MKKLNKKIMALLVTEIGRKLTTAWVERLQSVLPPISPFRVVYDPSRGAGLKDIVYLFAQMDQYCTISHAINDV